MLQEFFNLLKVVFAFIIYSFGYKDATYRRDAEEMKSDLDWRNAVEKKREDIRSRYRDLKYNTPDDWDSIEQLRKTIESQSSSKANNPSNSSGSKV